MVTVRARIKAAQAAKTARITYRQRVLAVIADANACLTGHDIASRSGLSYRQTIDALNELLNQGRVARTGRKFSARWCPLTDPIDPLAALQAAMSKMVRRP